MRLLSSRSFLCPQFSSLLFLQASLCCFGVFVTAHLNHFIYFASISEYIILSFFTFTLFCVIFLMFI